MESEETLQKISDSNNAMIGQTKTIYIRCKNMHNRGQLVNNYLYSHREYLGISNWYDAEGRLNNNVPLEIVYVKNSRKPFFLLEWRYSFTKLPQTIEPSAENESKKQFSKENCNVDTLQHANEQPTEDEFIVSEKELEQLSERLLRLPVICQTPLLFEGASVSILPAENGKTVEGERAKEQVRTLKKRSLQEKIDQHEKEQESTTWHKRNLYNKNSLAEEEKNIGDSKSNKGSNNTCLTTGEVFSESSRQSKRQRAAEPMTTMALLVPRSVRKHEKEKTVDETTVNDLM